jgi:3-ketoacyl-CoA synthase
MSEQLQFLAVVLLRCVTGRAMKVKPYMLDFKLALEYFYIHAGRRGVLNKLESSLGLSA